MSKQIFDPIHGFIKTTVLMQRIIDTPEFQRLRNLKQLGAVSYVFPSANHTRFEHSLGVSHLAGIMIQSLREKHKERGITERDTELVQIAGLVHDIGHGPYSHLYDHYIVGADEPKHEERGCAIFRDLVKKYSLPLTEEEVDDIILMIHPTCEVSNHWRYQIVANHISNVDVDKIDYLQRDSYHIGLRIGGEYSRLLTQCYIKSYRDPKAPDTICEVIAWPEKLQFEMFALFQTRYRLHKQIYNHHTVKAFEYIIAEILQHLSLKDIPFLDTNDGVVFCRLHPELRKIQNSLMARQIPKLVGERILSREQVKRERMPKYILDTIVDQITLGFAGAESGHPLNNIYYFKQHEKGEAFKVSASELSFCIPAEHHETILRMYVRNPAQMEEAVAMWQILLKNYEET